MDPDNWQQMILKHILLFKKMLATRFGTKKYCQNVRDFLKQQKTSTETFS